MKLDMLKNLINLGLSIFYKLKRAVLYLTIRIFIKGIIYMSMIRLWWAEKSKRLDSDYSYDIVLHDDLKCNIKSAKKYKRTRRTVAVLSARGKNFDIDVIEAKDGKVKIDGKFCGLPKDPYHLAGAKKLGKIKLKAPIPLYVLDSGCPSTLENVFLKRSKQNINIDENTLSELLNSSILTSFLRSMQIPLTTILMYMSLGYVVITIIFNFIAKIGAGS